MDTSRPYASGGFVPVPKRVVRSDFTIEFGGRLYSLAHLTDALPGSRVAVQELRVGAPLISVVIDKPGIHMEHLVRPIPNGGNHGLR